MAAMAQRIATLALRAAQLALAVLVAAYLASFAAHALLLLGFRFPLDYGEGPLLAQVERLRSGIPIWRLYADPAAPPYLIVNYPPVYLLLTAALTPLDGAVLSSGRLISLLAALGAVAALAMLATTRRQRARFTPHPASFYLSLLFLTVPIVREWAALMRVDMLGVCLGLWGLAVLSGGTRGPGPRRAALAGVLLLASLYTKPSLIAAPVAGGAWLLWRAWRAPAPERRSAMLATATLSGVLAVGGGLLFAAFQLASGGWFALHVVTANANRWDGALARGFWAQQFDLRWPLAAAAALAAISIAWPHIPAPRDGVRPTPAPPRGALSRTEPGANAAALRGRSPSPGHPGTLAPRPTLAVLYTLLGAVTAIGVGKVGAYSNYFLELYAGLVWLVALTGTAAIAASAALPLSVLRSAFYGLLVLSLLYYPPLWDANRLRPAGLIEPSPPRMAFGRYGLWADLARERAVLAAQARVGTVLVAEVKAAGPLIFTDMPGVAAAAGVDSRLQVFEARQLLDQGHADERALLHELANGELPLAVLDYLGNWLTPGVVAILTHRYAQDGSLGTFDLYRPVALGAEQPADLRFAVPAGALRLVGHSLAPPLGATYEPGELLAIGLTWQRAAGEPAGPLTVVVQLTTPDGTPILAVEQPLLYAAFPPADWPADAAVQHVQTLALPPELLEGVYLLQVSLRAGGDDLATPQPIGRLTVAAAGGAYVEETGQFVPAAMRRAWAELGAIERAGFPLTPVVPFAWGRLQCFERVCLELRGDAIQLRPLGAQLYLAETMRSDHCLDGEPAAGALCPGFGAADERFAELGPALSGELARNSWIVQWTAGARLERQPTGEAIGLGRLGEETLRLPPGVRYRWP